MKMKIGITLLFATFLILIFSQLATASYTVDWYVSNNFTGSSTSHTAVPSFQLNNSENCIVRGRNIVSSTGGSVEPNIRLYSPFTTIILDADAPSNNFMCLQFGYSTTTGKGGNGTYELNSTVQSNGGITNNTLHAQYVCNTAENAKIVVDREVSDSKGMIPNLLWFSYRGQHVNSTRILDKRGACEGDIYFKTYVRGNNISQPSPNIGTIQFVYAFNSSYLGIVNISVDTFQSFRSGAVGNPLLQIDIVSTNNETINIFPQTQGLGCANCYATNINGQILNKTNFLLNKDSQYYLVFNFQKGVGGDTQLNASAPHIEIEIDTRQPNYQCGGYSECQNNTQSRICEDQSQYNLPDKQEFRTCFSNVPFEDQVIGFEAADTVNVLECVKPSFLCTAEVQSVSIEHPKGWQVRNASYNVSDPLSPAIHKIAMLTTEESTDGFKSLRLTYRPPQIDTVTAINTCGNSTLGYNPSVQANVSSVATEITFPSPFSVISFDYKLPVAPLEQYTSPYFYCSPNKLCYGSCENTTINGDFFSRLFNNNTGETEFLFFGRATDQWQRFRFDLSNSGLQANIPYTMLFQLNPPDAFTGKSYSILIDNVRIENFDSSFNAPNGTCSDYCDGTDLFDADIINGSCSYTVTLNSSICRQQIEDQAEQERIAKEKENTEPLTFITDLFGLNGTNDSIVKEQNLGFVFFFFSPLFLSIIVILLLGGYLEFKTHTGGLAFGITTLTGLVLITIAGIMPIWFALVLVILAGLFIAQKVMGSFGGK